MQLRSHTRKRTQPNQTQPKHSSNNRLQKATKSLDFISKFNTPFIIMVINAAIKRRFTETKAIKPLRLIHTFYFFFFFVLTFSADFFCLKISVRQRIRSRFDEFLFYLFIQFWFTKSNAPPRKNTRDKNRCRKWNFIVYVMRITCCEYISPWDSYLAKYDKNNFG